MCDSGQEVRDQFETNVFGQLNVIRAVLPFMRARKSGVVANLGSIGSWQGSPAAGLYCATKACASILSESLRSEVAHLGIEVTAIEPGYFRTNFLSQGHKVHAAKTIEDIKPGVEATLGGLKAYDRNQPGDPVKGAQIIVEALTKSGRCNGKALPPRLPLGNDAVHFIGDVLNKNLKTLKDWGPLVSTTDV
jgi:NAD(P)-dependent dehydrogenase (short-subunit alcohol dehydrogenase family)